MNIMLYKIKNFLLFIPYLLPKIHPMAYIVVYILGAIPIAFVAPHILQLYFMIPIISCGVILFYCILGMIYMFIQEKYEEYNNRVFNILKGNDNEEEI